MKKLITNIAGWYITLCFILSPILLFIMYITYTEKIIIPILLMLTLIAGLIILVYNKEK